MLLCSFTKNLISYPTLSCESTYTFRVKTFVKSIIMVLANVFLEKYACHHDDDDNVISGKFN